MPTSFQHPKTRIREWLLFTLFVNVRVGCVFQELNWRKSWHETASKSLALWAMLNLVGFLSHRTSQDTRWCRIRFALCNFEWDRYSSPLPLIYNCCLKIACCGTNIPRQVGHKKVDFSLAKSHACPVQSEQTA